MNRLIFFHNRETLVHNFTNTWEISPIVGKFMYHMPHTTGTDSLVLAFLEVMLIPKILILFPPLSPLTSGL